ncbi:hypothetical protein ABZU32_39620, partial [Sphaerisporangium sp. NPDC005288]|uniref:hypothetical protein n=1 Tax=Sphaerisporangium sp. NPDC005288 TaxID=3155114 RepID=UPI0033B23EEA
GGYGGRDIGTCELLPGHIVPSTRLSTRPGQHHSLNANSVTAYQVIELPRTPQDQPEGVLRLALGPVTHRSWWEHAADFVDKKIENAPDLSQFGRDLW